MKIKTHFQLLLLLLTITGCSGESNIKSYDWTNVVDRIWAGENFWANRLQDWEVKDGKLICT